MLISPSIDAILSSLSLQSLSITYPTYSYRGAAAIYNKTLYSYNGYECNYSTTSQCNNNESNTTSNILHTLDISALTLTLNIANRAINESLITSQWTTTTSIDPIYVRQFNAESWPSMKLGTSTSSYSSSSQYGWIIFPSRGPEYKTKLALKFDLKTKQFVNISLYQSYINTTNRWSGACCANDGEYVYSVAGKKASNEEADNLVFKYHIQNDTWSELSNYPHTVFGASCTVLNGILYSFGGQTGCCMDDRISDIYAYDIGNDVWMNSRNKTGDLIQARVHGASVTHPNGWILTVGGRKQNNDMAEKIELFDPVTKQSVDTGLIYERQNFYRSKYQYDSDTQILFLWGGVYQPQNVIQEIYNDIQYIILSKYDALYPTASPTAAPSNAPSMFPTMFPTMFPSYSPSVSPTVITKDPTKNPTKYPTPSPTFNPTPSPTNNPTPSPTNDPSQPPTPSPTMNPTQSPIYLNEGEIKEYTSTESNDKGEESVIVNIIENDTWLAIVIIAIVFMVLCFGICIYWIYKKYHYEQKMKRHINVMDASSSTMKTEATRNQIEVEMVKADKMEEGEDADSDSDDGDKLYETNINVTKGNNVNIEDEMEDLYVEQEVVVTPTPDAPINDESEEHELDALYVNDKQKVTRKSSND